MRVDGDSYLIIACGLVSGVLSRSVGSYHKPSIYFPSVKECRALSVS